jgi:predicted nucleic acid-binding protein
MSHRILRVYADTSVFAGVFDAEFEFGSKLFFDRVTAGVIRIVISTSVEEELNRGPEHLRHLYAEMMDEAELVETSPEARSLSAAYLSHGVVSPRYAVDALHVAIATTAGCAAIVSWNFRHIVSFHRIPLYNAVNALNGYNPIAIHSPLEVLEYGEG